MKLHFKAKYNMEYETRTPCVVNSLINGSIDISDDDIYISTFRGIDEWLEHFVDYDLIFGEFTDIEWNKHDLEDLKEAFKRNQLNESNN